MLNAIKNGEENTFNYYSTLRAYDKLKFVNFVTDTLINDNYNSVIRGIMFDIAIVHIMTDVDVFDVINSHDPINQIEDFLNETNIVEIVRANTENLIKELDNAVDLAIEYKTGIHKNPIAESLSRLLNTLEKKVSGIDTDSMIKAAKMLSGISGELTIDKMLEAYSKSDLFKQKHSELKTKRNTKKTNNDKNIISMN